jgi:hypothetical protein
MKIKDWNEAHSIKEKIEEDYDVYVHILGRGCFIKANDYEVIKANNYKGVLALYDDPNEVEHISGLEWFERTVELFYKKVEELKIQKRI